MSIRSSYSRVRDVEIVDGDCGYPGADLLDPSNHALVTNAGGDNLYIEGTLDDLLTLAHRINTYVSIERSKSDDD